MTALKSQFVLDQVNALIDQGIAKYNQKAAQTGNFQLGRQGGARFQNPMLSDYAQVNGVTRGRMYQIEQDFFVSIPIFTDPTITLTFQLGLMIDLSGDSILAFILNPSVNIDLHGAPGVPDSTIQQAHDAMIAFASQADKVIPVPIPGITLLSVKVLTEGAGVGLSQAQFQALGGSGVLAALIKP
ncbi:MAG TPA: hypothetical protein VJX67_20455 [Blastocatellia bacterium]|nr:hypothetical protein [Blastocatellia bacterium]